MCMCIIKPENKEIPLKVLEQCYNNNPDGIGMLFSVKVELDCFKGNMSFDAFKNLYLKFSNYGNMIIHFRTASASGFGNEYCHPFYVNKNLAFVHNGNLFEFSSYFRNRKKDDLIDTQRFNNEILKKLPSNFLAIKSIRNKLEEYCKNNMSKMIFMDLTGKYTIINEEAGIWKYGCWFSNGGMDNYSGYGFSGAYKYKTDDIRHKGGLPTIQMFSEERRKKYFQCSNCGGYYIKHNQNNKICNGCDSLFKLWIHTKEIKYV